MNIRTNILLRVYIAFGLILFLAVAVVFQLYRVQYIQGTKWKTMSSVFSTKYQTVEASRGSIFADDGSLLATSVPEYDLHMDMTAAGITEEAVFTANVDSLAISLAKLFPERSIREYSMILRDGRKAKVRYQLIKRGVTYQELKQVRKFPIFRIGKYSGGLIVEQQNRRILPYKSLAARTIGYYNENVKNPVGLEGAYAGYIKGESGRRLMQRIAGGLWMPVKDVEEIPSKEGADIISTINVNYQDVAQDALKKQLIKSEADYGCVVLMEVATGEIRAIANFTRSKTGEYEEKLNYAISNAADPGSTFKLATYMAAFDQHKIDTNTLIDVQGGKYKPFKTLTITDAELGNGVMTAKHAFEESSNVAAAKFIYDHYNNNPKQFTDKLYSFGLNKPLGLQIPGEGMPVVKNPNSRSWSKFTLPEMAYGYEMKITPLQMLTFYNAVANNGRMIAPIFVKEIRRYGSTVEQFQARVINEKVCTDATLGKMRSMLEGVVTEGTGKNVIKNSLYTVAGKTGTAQIANGTAGYGLKTYQASFCGYFPADHPRYAMIVVINHPTTGAYLAALVAGPVFREIADRVFSSDLGLKQATAPHYVGNTNMPKIKKGNTKALKLVYNNLSLKPQYAVLNAKSVDTTVGLPYEDLKFKEGVVPGVTGMGLSDALYLLGNAGYKVTVHGSGVVASQSVTGGSLIPKGSKITIELQ